MPTPDDTDALRTLVADAWRAALGEEPTDASDFLAHGRSLEAAVFCNLVAGTTGRPLGLAALYERPRFGDVLTVVRDIPAEGPAAPAAPVAAAPGPVPLRPTQRDRWEEHRADPTAPPDVVAAEVTWAGVDLDVDLLRDLLTSVLGAHDAFRSRIVEVDGVATTELLPEPGLVVTAHRAGDAAVWAEELAALVGRPFALEEGEVARVHLRRGSGSTTLAVAIHHIVCDDVSLQLLLDGLAALVQGGAVAVVPPLETPAGDAPAGAHHLDEWVGLLAGAAPARVLDRTPGAAELAAMVERDPLGVQCYLPLDDAAAHALGATAARLGTTSTCVFLAAMARLVGTDGLDLLIALSTSQRRASDAGVVGGFATDLPFPLPSAPAGADEALVARVTERVALFMETRFNPPDVVAARYEAATGRPPEPELLVATTTAPELPEGVELRSISPPRCKVPLQLTLIEGARPTIRWEHRPEVSVRSEIQVLHHRVEEILLGLATEPRPGSS